MNENSNESPMRRFLKRALAGAIATSTAEITTIPLDTAKVRLQVQGQLGKGQTISGSAPYKGTLNCLRRIVVEEGIGGLFVGITPGVFRQLTYGTARLAIYQPIRNFYDQQWNKLVHKQNDSKERPKTSSNFFIKVVAGLTSGAIAICFGQPADVIKIRFQADPNRYSNFLEAIIKIPKQDGIAGLWRGIGPNIARNCVINTAQLAVYDQIKEFVLQYKEDGKVVQSACGFLAGFAAVVFGSPFDVVKTRIMQSQRVDGGKPIYRSAPHAFYKIMMSEGPLAFYQGFMPNVMRLGSWSTVMFLTYEQVAIQLYKQ